MSDNMTDVLAPSDEQDFDFAGSSAVEVKTATFTITDVESENTESANGRGVRHNLTFESPDFPYPIILRLFTEYVPNDTSKSTAWVERQRGTLKNIAKAALGRTGYSLNPASPSFIGGRQVIATTKDDGSGFATLGKFKKVA